MHAVGGLHPDPAAVAVEHSISDLFVAMGRQAMQEDRIGGGQGHQPLIDLEPLEVATPLLGLRLLPH